MRAVYIQAYKNLFLPTGFDKQSVQESIHQTLEETINTMRVKPAQIILCANEEEILKPDAFQIPITIIKKVQNSDIESIELACAMAQHNNGAILCLNYQDYDNKVTQEDAINILQMKEKYNFSDEEIHFKKPKTKEDFKNGKIFSSIMITPTRLTKNSAKIKGMAKYKGPKTAFPISPIFACAKLFNKFKLHPDKIDAFQINSCDFTKWAFAKAFSIPNEKLKELSEQFNDASSSIINNILNAMDKKETGKVGVGISNNSNGEALAIAFEL